MYVDEEMKDVGANVRQKAKDITNLLQDDDRLRRERRSYVAPYSASLIVLTDSLTCCTGKEP